MLKNKRGLVTALLCVAMTMIFGCAKDEPLYTTGLAAQTESETAEETNSGVEDAAGVAADGSNSGSMADSAEASGSVTVSSGSSGTLAGLDTGTESLPDTTETQTEAVTGYVYVCGAVKEPGVYPITADMRVCDAVALAGGFSSGADEEWLNQASVVSDGQKLYIYTIEETDLMRASGMTAEGMDSTADAANSGSTNGTGTDNVSGAAVTDADSAAVSVTGDSGTDSSDGRVNLNTATRDQLMALPGIGESKADAIIAYREEHGAFASIEEIQNISGIKSGVFSQIKDLITV